MEDGSDGGLQQPWCGKKTLTEKKNKEAFSRGRRIKPAHGPTYKLEEVLDQHKQATNPMVPTFHPFFPTLNAPV